MKPDYYHKGKTDVIQFLQDFFPDENISVTEGFFIGNIIKYVCRFKNKNGVEDLMKANDYLKKLIVYESERKK